MTKLVNRAKMTTATTGTGTLTLGSAVDGYQTFAAAGVADADVVRYVIEDGTAWEIGTGTYTASGTTLSRTVVESSNADAAINLTGTAVVFVGAVEADLREERVGSISGATLDLSTGTVFSDAPATDPTYVFSNPPASGTAYGFTLKVTPSATVTITWPASVKWPSGTAPDAPADGETSVFVFYTQDGGTQWFGFLAGDAMS
jgi:hypothetical protein